VPCHVSSVSLMEAHFHVLLFQDSLTVTCRCFFGFSSGHDFIHSSLLRKSVSLRTLRSGRSLSHRRIMQTLL